MAEQVLAVAAAHKTYGAVKALQGVDFHLARGEWLALLGPNGAGKSTLVRSLAGRVRLDSGRLSLLGRELEADSFKGREQLGIVPQEIALYDHLTARENLYAFGRYHGVSGKQLQERIAWALKWIALEDRAEMQVKGFSGGMKRRLNIAAAVLHRPEVILLDEPTVGVDPQSRQRIWDMLDELRREGVSLVLTTHQLDEAQTVCDRIVIVDHGKVIAAGTLAELIARTVGKQRLVIAKLAPAAGATQEEERQRAMLDLPQELPDFLRELEGTGRELRDLHIQVPNLQAVFLHLTGRELRE